jgi:type II secretory pathway pseudopilin PulG
MLQRDLQSQKGFGLIAVFLVVVILVSVLTYFVASSGMATSASTDQISRARASSIITQGGLLRGAYDRLVANGMQKGYDTYDADPPTGLFGPVGGIDVPNPDPGAYNDARDPYGFWNRSGTPLAINGVGTPGKNPFVAITAGLKDSVCMAINELLHQFAAIPQSGYTIDDIGGGAGMFSVWSRGSPYAWNPLQIDLTSLHQIDGWESGCLATTSGINIYYHVVQHQ